MNSLSPDLAAMMRPPVAEVAPTSPRHALWMRLFGTNRLPIRSRQWESIGEPGKKKERVYLLDIDRLNSEQRVAMAIYMASRLKITVAQACAIMSGPGVPIACKGATLVENEQEEEGL